MILEEREGRGEGGREGERIEREGEHCGRSPET